MKPKFDGYAAQYDAWFMENENVFQSEFRLFEKALGDISGKRVLSVGCGSGLFESMIDCKNIEGVEPSRDMGAIAQKRGINVIAFDALKSLGFHDFDFYQTLLRNPMYTNEVVEDVVPGYQSGGYVAIIAHK